MKTSVIYPGGIFRCCMGAIIADDGPDEAGRTIRSECCNIPLTFMETRQGLPGWAWDKDLEDKERKEGSDGPREAG